MMRAHLHACLSPPFLPSSPPPFELPVQTACEVLDKLLVDDDEVVQVWYLMGWAHFLLENKAQAAEYLVHARDLYSRVGSDQEVGMGRHGVSSKSLAPDLTSPPGYLWSHRRAACPATRRDQGGRSGSSCISSTGGRCSRGRRRRRHGQHLTLAGGRCSLSAEELDKPPYIKRLRKCLF